jgi:hypothetical protein
VKVFCWDLGMNRGERGGRELTPKNIKIAAVLEAEREGIECC